MTFSLINCHTLYVFVFPSRKLTTEILVKKLYLFFKKLIAALPHPPPPPLTVQLLSVNTAKGSEGVGEAPFPSFFSQNYFPTFFPFDTQISVRGLILEKQK
jgi:hypothetical protein